MTVFSPPVTPTIYRRGKDGYGDEIRKMQYEDWVLLVSKVPETDGVVMFGDSVLMYRSDIGDVFIADDHAHVADSMYRIHPIMFLQEFVANAIMDCSRKGVIDEVLCTNDKCVYGGGE